MDEDDDTSDENGDQDVLDNILISSVGRNHRKAECLLCHKVWQSYQKSRIMSHILEECPGTSVELRETYNSKTTHDDSRKDLLEGLYLKHIVMNSQPFTITHPEYLREIFTHLNVPNFPPLTNRITGELMRKYVRRSNTFFNYLVSQSGESVTLEFDFWSDKKRRSIWACVVNIGYPNKYTFVHSVSDKTDYVHEARMIKCLIADAINDIGPEHVVAIVSDQASNMKAAREMAVAEFPGLIQSRCLAHYANLLLQDNFDIPCIKETFAKAKDVVSYIRGHSALRNHASMRNLKTFVQVRWYSALGLMNSLNDLKDSILQQFQPLNQSFSRNVTAILQSNQFWSSLNNTILMLDPINDVIRVAESNTCKLSDFFYHLIIAGKKIHSYNNAPVGKDSFDKYLKRFHSLDHPLLFAAYMIDPRYRGGFLKKKAWDIGELHLLKMAKLMRFTQAEGKSVARDVLHMKEGSMPFDRKEDSLKWWSKHESRPTYHIAKKLLSIKASSANVERLFSFLTWNHTPKRNMLSVRRMEQLAKLRYYFSQTETAHDKIIPLELSSKGQRSVFEPFVELIDIDDLADSIENRGDIEEELSADAKSFFDLIVFEDGPDVSNLDSVEEEDWDPTDLQRRINSEAGRSH